MTQLHTLLDLNVTNLFRGTPLAHVVLLLGTLGPVGSGGPGDRGEAPVLLVLTGLDGLGALLGVAVLAVTHVALQPGHGGDEERKEGDGGQEEHPGAAERVKSCGLILSTEN